MVISLSMSYSGMAKFRIHSVVLLLAGITMAGTAPETPAPIDKIVYAQPFTLENGLAYPRREGKPQVNAGYLLIIDADPKLVLQRAMPSPILYVGKEIGWRLNPGYPSGRAFVLVAAELDKSGKVDLDLTRTRIWFGAPVPGLKGVLDKQRIEREHELAVAAGIGRRPKKEIETALGRADGQPRAFKDFGELRRHYARLMKAYLPPDEDKQGDTLLMLKRVGEK